MAYPYYPTGYNNYYPSQPTPVLQGQPVQTQTVPQIPQIQNGGLVRVMNEEEARNYPVAPGYSVTFIDDSVNYCYTKTAGFSQFDKPRFEKYRLTKEEPTDETDKTTKEEKKDTAPEYALKFELDKLRAEFRKVKERVDELYE